MIYFNKNDKKTLYQLINFFLEGTIDAEYLCNEYYKSFDLEININDFSNEELTAFTDLSFIVSRYSNSNEDIIDYPNTYFNEIDLKKKVIETKEKLEYQFSLFIIDNYKKFLNETIRTLISQIIEIKENKYENNQDILLGFYYTLDNIINQLETYNLFDLLDDDLKKINLKTLFQKDEKK